jgi:protease-4
MNASDLIRNAWLTLANAARRVRRLPPTWVSLPLSGDVTERSQTERRPFPLSLLRWPVPPSVEAFDTKLQALAADSRIPGVVIRLGALSAGPATLASLRQVILRFRAGGRQAVAWTPSLDTWHLYLATACDKIMMPASGSFDAAGFRIETFFLKDALALLGLRADLEAIGAYEAAPDTFRRSAMTEPHREMLESLLESLEAEVVDAVGRGRSVPPSQVRAWFDAVPMSAADALAAGAIDAIAYEDELATQLGGDIAPWEQVQRRVRRERQWVAKPQIGVVRMQGMIVMGPSRRSPLPVPLPLPFPTQYAGAETIIQALRTASADRRIAAVVLHVDSPGGSALASDLIWREVTRLRTRKPIVAWLGNQATSGGYYVSAPADWIVAQPGTLTGAIGVWGGKVVLGGLWEKAGAGAEAVQRGARAGLYSSLEPFRPEERAAVRAQMRDGYARFKASVAVGRGMTPDAVEAVARGRVWTGAQALEQGLVDALGGFQDALDKARELANLDPAPTVRAVPVIAGRRWVPPTGEGLERAGWRTLWREHTWALAPWDVRVTG